MAGPAFADGDAAAGETAAVGCIGCHGADGNGVGENPPVTGFEYEALVTSMTAYRSKEREEMMMNMLFASMSDEDIANLAAYYALMTAE
jgi:cytochrome c553